MIPAIPRRYTLALWLLGSALAFILCMYEMRAAVVDGQFIPADHDSFYHARRILDAIPDLGNFYQFDPRIHAPEGSWITWPWAYDFLMAALARGAMAVTGAQQPLTLLAFVAPAWVLVNAWLLLGSARELRLPLPLQAAVMFCFATSMLTRALHRVGMLDHHYLEHTFVLATLWCGLRWCAQPADRWRALQLGLVLGAAPAFHNGEFILQLPVVLTALVLWWRGTPLDAGASRRFALGLVGATLLVALPSEPLQRGMFDFRLLSWFHPFVAGLSAAAVLWAAHTQRTGRALLLGAALLALALLPLLRQASAGGGWLTGQFEQMAAVTEARSLYAFLRDGEAGRLTRFYSALLWLLPAALAWVWWRLRASWRAESLYLAIHASFGVALLLLQFRLQYFGAFAIWLLPALWAEQQAARRPPAQRTRVLLIASALLVAAALPGALTVRLAGAAGGDAVYARLRPMFLALQAQCKAAPGVVLADYNLGHYITFHSDCAVIADNFTVTAQHEAKVLQSLRLLGGTPGELSAAAPFVRYVLVERQDRVGIDSCFPDCPANRGLRHELLERGAPYPGGWRLLGELQAEVAGATQPLARLFALDAAEPP